MTTEAAMRPSMSFDVNGTTVTIEPERRGSRIVRVLIVVALAVAALALLMPLPAQAGIIEDALAGVSQFFTDMLNGFCEGLTNGTMNFINTLSPETLANRDFESLLGAGDVSLYQMVRDICDVSVKPVAASVLTLVMLGQVIKISQRVDATATMPALKEVMVLFFTFVVGMYLVRHGLDLAGDIYDIFRVFISGISGGVKELKLDYQAATVDTALGDFIGCLLACFIVFIVGAIARILANCMMLARAIQIYLYAAFAPLMFAFFGLDETRQWSLGFLKGFMSACLSGFIIYFSIAAFPYVMSSMFVSGDMASMVTSTTITVPVVAGDGMNWVLGIAAACVALALMCIKSGTFAREILGG